MYSCNKTWHWVERRYKLSVISWRLHHSSVVPTVLPLASSCVAALRSLYLIRYMHFMGSEGSVLYDWLVQIKIVTYMSSHPACYPISLVFFFQTRRLKSFPWDALVYGSMMAFYLNLEKLGKPERCVMLWASMSRLPVWAGLMCLWLNLCIKQGLPV